MPCGKRLSYTWLLLSWALGLLAGCTEGELSPRDDTWVGVCIDRDGDGYGFQCKLGPDCDDQDPAYGAECPRCTRPGEGCECDEGAAPVDCKVSKELTAEGALLCKVGTRFCRDGRWSGCEGVVEFQAPPPNLLRVRAAIDPNVLHPICDDCNPDCYYAQDPLDAPPDAAVGNQTVPVNGGGITLVTITSDAGVVEPGLLDDVTCTPGTAPDLDCDGIPDDFDAYPNQPPFSTDHRTIFMDLAPGQAKTQPFEINFFLNAADVYFYLDMTASMEDERDNLISSLTTGNYLPNSGTGLDCADRDFDGRANNELKNQGIAGNIACLIRDSHLGAGWFRDIPFEGPYANGTKVASSTFEPYENRQDITDDVDKVVNALKEFDTSGNNNVPEGSMQGLWAIATGGEVYAGWNRPGIPSRRGCPAETWGYPCFRDSAVPIVVHITDAPLQNGPSPTAPARAGYLTDCSSSDRECVRSETGCTKYEQVCTAERCCGTFLGFCIKYCCDKYETQCTKTGTTCLETACKANASSRHPLNYDANVLAGMKSGTVKSYLHPTASAESLTTAEVVGSINGKLLTYAGNTREMTADHTTYANVGGNCTSGTGWDSTSAAPEAVFRFTVTTKTTFVISSKGSHFPTSLMVRNLGGGTRYCATGSTSVMAAEISQQLDVGDWYAIVKGKRTSDKGWFQLTMGEKNKETTEAFQPKVWTGSGGIREALLQRGVRVITVNSSNDEYLKDQAEELSRSTGALSVTNAPLTFTINSNGKGMGTAIIDAVNLLAGNLAMNVGVILKEAPDKPMPGFLFRVEAVDMPGDSCEAPIDTDNDPQHLPDTHVKCRPGASPRFRVTFENRAVPNHVPLNPNDPFGGYNMRLQLIGDGQYVVSEIPVYIIPETVIPTDSDPKYATSGTYEQRVTANGCLPGEQPVWRKLIWNAKMPPETRIKFQACGGTTEAEVDACTLFDVATVRGGTTMCNVDADCPDTYCDVSGYCRSVTGTACDEDDECGAKGYCSADQLCKWTSSEVDMKPALVKGLQGRDHVRVRITLYADSTQENAPTLNNWRLDYVCTSQE